MKGEEKSEVVETVSMKSLVLFAIVYFLVSPVW